MHSEVFLAQLDDLLLLVGVEEQSLGQRSEKTVDLVIDCYFSFVLDFEVVPLEHVGQMGQDLLVLVVVDYRELRQPTLQDLFIGRRGRS